MLMLVLCCFSRVQLFCDPMDCGSLGSSVHGILQARTLQWAATASSREPASLVSPALPADSLWLSNGEAHTYHTVHYISRAYLLLIVSVYPFKILFCPQSPTPGNHHFTLFLYVWLFKIPYMSAVIPWGDITSQLLEKAVVKRQEKTSVYKNVEKREPLCIVGENVNWCSHCWKESGGCSKN